MQGLFRSCASCCRVESHTLNKTQSFEWKGVHVRTFVNILMVHSTLIQYIAGVRLTASILRTEGTPDHTAVRACVPKQPQR